MDKFENYLETTEEVGMVSEVIHSVIYIEGLPGVSTNELLYFESGSIGQVITIEKDIIGALFIAGNERIKVGERVARSDKSALINVSDEILGKHIRSFEDYGVEAAGKNARLIEAEPPTLMKRKQIDKNLETGVSIVDTIVPIAKGQRELVIGDKGTGKTVFLMQTVLTQVSRGMICIYAIVGKRASDIKQIVDFINLHKIQDKTVLVSSKSSDAPGMIHFTPYTAMAIAEYFRDKGMDVLVVMDDLTTHAKNYREISLLSKRFPGRGSYPGDIFYIHSKLMERAGSFQKGSITCLPAASSIMGSLSGYIQTNLMAMTDGHIFFDIDLFDKGIRPAVNPFLSVTRVGHKAQTPLQRSLSREVSSFLVKHDKLSDFLHFGAEVGEETKQVLDMGDKLYRFFNQSPNEIIPVSINILILGGLWANVWAEKPIQVMEKNTNAIVQRFIKDAEYSKSVNKFISNYSEFSQLVSAIKQDDSILTMVQSE